MADIVAVREIDERPGLDDTHARYELAMNLVDDGMRGGACPRGGHSIERFGVHHHVRQRRPRGIADVDPHISAHSNASEQGCGRAE